MIFSYHLCATYGRICAVVPTATSNAEDINTFDLAWLHGNPSLEGRTKVAWLHYSFLRKGTVQLTVLRMFKAVMNSRLSPHRFDTVQMPQYAEGSPDFPAEEQKRAKTPQLWIYPHCTHVKLNEKAFHTTKTHERKKQHVV